MNIIKITKEDKKAINPLVFSAEADKKLVQQFMKAKEEGGVYNLQPRPDDEKIRHNKAVRYLQSRFGKEWESTVRDYLSCLPYKS